MASPSRCRDGGGMRVIFYSLDEQVGEIELTKGGLKYTGAAADIVRDLVVLEPDNPDHVLTPDDGEAYLSALPYEFRSPYLWAVLK